MHTPGSHHHSTAQTVPRVALASPKQRSTYPEDPSPCSTSTLDLFAYGRDNCPGLLVGHKRPPVDRLSLREYQSAGASPCGPSDHWVLGYPRTLFYFAPPLCATRHYRDNPTRKDQPRDKGCLNSFHPRSAVSQAHTHNTIHSVGRIPLEPGGIKTKITEPLNRNRNNERAGRGGREGVATLRHKTTDFSFAVGSFRFPSGELW